MQGRRACNTGLLAQVACVDQHSPCKAVSLAASAISCADAIVFAATSLSKAANFHAAAILSAAACAYFFSAVAARFFAAFL